MKKREFKIDNTFKEIVIITLVVFALTLSCTMLLLIKNTNHIQEEYSLTNDVHNLRSEIRETPKLKNMKNENNVIKHIQGFIEIQETNINEVNIIGSVEGLEKGSAHGLHVIRYNDYLINILSSSNSNSNKEIELYHLNPSNSKLHDCPTIEQKNKQYHEGDIGNIIANEKGVASFAIQKNISIRAFIGRMIILLDTKDVCNPNNYKDSSKDVIALGSLSVFKPNDVFFKDIKHYNDYLIREVNSFSKSSFFDNKTNGQFQTDKSKYSINDNMFDRKDENTNNSVDKYYNTTIKVENAKENQEQINKEDYLKEHKITLISEDNNNKINNNSNEINEIKDKNTSIKDLIMEKPVMRKSNKIEDNKKQNADSFVINNNNNSISNFGFNSNMNKNSHSYNTDNTITHNPVKELKNIDENIEIRKKMFLQMREKLINNNNNRNKRNKIRNFSNALIKN